MPGGLRWAVLAGSTLAGVVAAGGPCATLDLEVSVTTLRFGGLAPSSALATSLPRLALAALPLLLPRIVPPFPPFGPGPAIVGCCTGKRAWPMVGNAEGIMVRTLNPGENWDIGHTVLFGKIWSGVRRSEADARTWPYRMLHSPRPKSPTVLSRDTSTTSWWGRTSLAQIRNWFRLLRPIAR